MNPSCEISVAIRFAKDAWGSLVPDEAAGGKLGIMNPAAYARSAPRLSCLGARCNVGK